MDEDTYRAALVKAAQLLGGVRPLCDRVHVPIPVMTQWLAGDGKPPIAVFLRAVDILIEEGDKPRFMGLSNDPGDKPSSGNEQV